MQVLEMKSALHVDKGLLKFQFLGLVEFGIEPFMINYLVII